VRWRDNTGATGVAERALLVGADAGNRWAIALAQWGGTDRAIAAVCRGTPPTALPDCVWQSRGEAATFHHVLSHLDYLGTAAVYRVGEQQSGPQAVTVFCPLWFGLPLAEVTATPHVGGLVAVDSLADLRRLRRQFRDLKGLVADAVRSGLLSPAAAVTTLYRAIAGLRGRERSITVAPGVAERFSPETGPDRP